MKIPEHIGILLHERTDLAIRLMQTCRAVNSWCKEHGIDPYNAWHEVSVKSYIPVESAEKYLRLAIENAEEPSLYLAGKTIERADLNNDMLDITFTDGTNLKCCGYGDGLTLEV